MKKLMLSVLGVVAVLSVMIPVEVLADQRRRVVVRRPVRRPVRHTRLVVHRGHPVRRSLPTTVVVRPARRTVVVGAPLVFLPAVAWSAAVVSLPARQQMIWEDSEVIARDEGWVDANFGVDGRGNALFLQIEGKAQLNFAEVAFANGNVQVVDFNDRKYNSGTYRLLDFADGRHVKTARILAKSDSDDTKLTIYLSK